MPRLITKEKSPPPPLPATKFTQQEVQIKRVRGEIKSLFIAVLFSRHSCVGRNILTLGLRSKKKTSHFYVNGYVLYPYFNNYFLNFFFPNVLLTMTLYGAETWTLRAADQKYLESFEMWCWRRMEKISWTDNVRNEDVLLRVNGQRNILHEIRKRKANWIGHILRRNCLLKQVIEGKIKGEMEVTRRRGRRRKKLLDDLKDRRG